MMGRPLCSDAEAMLRGFVGADCARRREVLRETIAAFEAAGAMQRYRRLAQQNLDRWHARRSAPSSTLQLEVRSGDWGEVTHSVTSSYGTCFAVLNMANAFVPGGAYVEGAVAQEENMFRRSDCHFRIGDDEFDRRVDRYRPEMTRMLTAQEGVVYLDERNPRVCIRGPEDRARPDLGYAWLPEGEIFPFFELRAAAQDLRDGSAFDPGEARRRIVAQLETLRERRVRHVVLGAFGCGAFRNPAEQVARIYRDEIVARAADFAVVVFAIFSAGYGPDNFTPFAKVLSE
jgi:hypothetical protein